MFTRLLKLMAITATVTVIHATPADGSFSVAGVAAWNGAGAHTITTDVTGYATVADTGAYANLSGKPTIPSLADAWPVGSIFMTTSATDPATLLGFGTWSALPGKFLVGVSTGNADFGVGASGGATGVAFTPSGSNAISLTREAVAGSNAISLFREAVAGTNAASVVTGSVSVEWPTGVPTFAGVTSSGHQHGLPISHNATAVYFPATGSAWGVGTTIGFDTKLTVIGATGTNLVAVTSSLAAMASQTAGSTVPAGVISWPATAPSAMIKTATAAAQVFTGVTGSVSGQVFTGVTASVSGQVFTGVNTNIAILPPYRAVYMWERTA